MTLSTAVTIDLAVVLVSAAMLIPGGRTRLSHPGVIYLIFHVSVISARGLALHFGGVPTLGLTEAEAARALNYADVLLLTMSLVWLLSNRRIEQSKPPSRNWAPLSPTYVIALSVICIPIGTYFLLRYAYVPGQANGASTVTTSYQIFAITWPGLMLIACIYLWGFRWYLVTPMAVYLLLMALQGYGRFRFVLPIVLLAQIWLDRRGRIRPPAWMALAAIAVIAVFIPLKGVGLAVQNGTFNPGSAGAIIKESTQEAIRGDSTEQSVFDQYAASLTLADEYGKPLYGENYLAVVTLPIPRQYWAEKPVLNQSIQKLSSRERPLAEIGAVLLLPGDLYADFRLGGLVLFGAVFAALLARWYRSAYSHGFLTTSRFFYLLVASNLIQVYRDGPISIPVFLLVHNLPLVVLVLLHWRGLRPINDGDPANRDWSAHRRYPKIRHA